MSDTDYPDSNYPGTDHPGYSDRPVRDDTSTHPLNVGYLVVGLVFLGVSGIWALRAAGVLDAGTLGWLVPAVLMAAGSAGLLAAANKEWTRRHRDADADPEDEHR